MIKTYKIFANESEFSTRIKKYVMEKMNERGYEYNKSHFDLAIAIGGDGSFLRMVNECNFNDKTLYVGINTGTLGFAQELYPEDMDHFLDSLEKKNYKIEYLGVQETKVYLEDSVSHFYSLNEIVLREQELNTLHIDININNDLLETFVGDGVLISTSFGSSAYNLSFGGSLVYNELHTLQITPIAPLNSKSYRSLINSIIIPENRLITCIPKERSKNLIITVDGVNNIYKNVEKIETFIKKKKIQSLRLFDYDYTKKINEKFAKS